MEINKTCGGGGRYSTRVSKKRATFILNYSSIICDHA